MTKYKERTMKFKAILLILIAILLTGCNLMENIDMDYLHSLPIPEYDVDVAELTEWMNKREKVLSDAEKLITAFSLWKGKYYEYKYDWDSHGVPDYWQTPAETENLKTYDCEDLAIFYMWCHYQIRGYSDNLTFHTEKLPDGDYHAIIYDAETSKYYFRMPDAIIKGYKPNITKSYSFEEAIKIAHYYHNN